MAVAKPNASASAQRCSKLWYPPGVAATPGVSEEPNAGITGVRFVHAGRRPQIRPVPRGPNSHLWHPDTRKSAPSSSGVAVSAPNPCTPSTHSSVASPFLALMASAIARIGSFTPVLECTQVTATIRVRGVRAADSRLTIWSTLAVAGSS